MNKKVPLRMCVVCKNSKPKKDCIRVVKTDTGYVVDATGKLNGRGAYVCKDSACIEKCLKTHAFNRSFKHNIGEDVYINIKETNIE